MIIGNIFHSLVEYSLVMLSVCRFFVFGLYPPEQKFTITITIEQLEYSRKDGDDVWTTISSLEIGPHKRIAKSEDFFVNEKNLN